MSATIGSTGAVRVAIAGVGNCASSLVQGIAHYSQRRNAEPGGLMFESIGGYAVSDIEVVAAFDVDERKVGLPLHEAIHAAPNCTTRFAEVAPGEVTVQMGPALDGIAPHMLDAAPERGFRLAGQRAVDVAEALRAARADVLMCYLPVGAEQAVKHYAQACIDSGTALVNCVPVFVASDPGWAGRFADAGVPVVGDDIKSQLGATVVHRVLRQLFEDRGVTLDRTYQLNTGGNSDFLNMRAAERLIDKKRSKTEAVQSAGTERIEDDNVHIGPSDYVPWQGDNKVAFIRLEGRGFGDSAVELELRLSVQDSPNSAGSAIDALRFAKLALDRELGGPVAAPSAYYMKSPPKQLSEEQALGACRRLAEGD